MAESTELPDEAKSHFPELVVLIAIKREFTRICILTMSASELKMTGRRINFTPDIA
jgi:hypothetical protein